MLKMPWFTKIGARQWFSQRRTFELAAMSLQEAYILGWDHGYEAGLHEMQRAYLALHTDVYPNPGGREAT